MGPLQVHWPSPAAMLRHSLPCCSSPAPSSSLTPWPARQARASRAATSARAAPSWRSAWPGTARTTRRSRAPSRTTSSRCSRGPSTPAAPPSLLPPGEGRAGGGGRAALPGSAAQSPSHPARRQPPCCPCRVRLRRASHRVKPWNPTPLQIALTEGLRTPQQLGAAAQRVVAQATEALLEVELSEEAAVECLRQAVPGIMR